MALVLYAAIALEATSIWRLPMVQMIGNASYAIYLTHDYAIFVVRMMVQHYALSGMSMLVTSILLAVALACAIGYGVHRLIERPVIYFLRRYFEPAAEPPVL